MSIDNISVMLILLLSSLSGCTSLFDEDEDGISDNDDNCPSIPNPLQLNFDNDAYGDSCDNDKDNDGWMDDGSGVNWNWLDECRDLPKICPDFRIPPDDLPYDPTEHLDTDDDGIGNNADNDDDNDGTPDIDDFYPLGNGEIRIKIDHINAGSLYDYSDDGVPDFLIDFSIDKECDGNNEIEVNMREQEIYWPDLRIIVPSGNRNVETPNDEPFDYTFDLPEDTKSSCLYFKLYEYKEGTSDYMETSKGVTFDLFQEEGYHEFGHISLFGNIYFSICFPGNEYESMMSQGTYKSKMFDC